MKAIQEMKCWGGRWSLALVLVAVPFAAECIPDGTTTDVPFERPPAPSGEDPGKPTYWSGGTGVPQAEEIDGLNNDSMGRADPGDGQASVPVKNDGGVLRDREGDKQNGLGEGPCLEVQVCWTAFVYETRWRLVLFKLDISEGFTGGGIDLRWKRVTKYWAEEVCSEVKEICPEGDC